MLELSMAQRKAQRELWLAQALAEYQRRRSMECTAVPFSDRDALDELEKAVFGLLYKFHVETDCGKPEHWAECERLVEQVGWINWETWRDVALDLEV
jgi:hypothetical protein